MAHEIKPLKAKVYFIAVVGNDIIELVNNLIHPQMIEDVTLDVITDILTNYFKHEGSAIVERYKFLKKEQTDCESVNEFIL